MWGTVGESRALYELDLGSRLSKRTMDLLIKKVSHDV